MSKHERNLSAVRKRETPDRYVERNRVIVRLLDEISRSRPLGPEEESLRRSLADVRPLDKRLRWQWTHEELTQIDNLNARRAVEGNPKPFSINTEVRDLADSMGRTYWATLRMIERRRKGNCSSAAKGMEG